MRILWLCNVMLPKIAQSLGKEPSVYGGWLTGLSNDLLKREEITLGVCFPITDQKELLIGQIDNLQYYGFYQSKLKRQKYDESVEVCFKTLLNNFKPDVIHIFGTEYPTSLAMTKSCQALGISDKVVISIQGLVSVCERHYYAGLPHNVVNAYTFKELIRHNNIKQSRKIFVRNGVFEIEAIKNVKHIIGRTDWDKACTQQLNPNANYHFCNETLRDNFYKHNWDINTCQRHSIFISQAEYPIKGLHRVLEAMPEIIKRFPDAHIYVSGSNITKYNTLRDKLLISSYGKYIKKLIKKYKLDKYISFVGRLSEEEMCKQFLKSHVFVSPSSIENSPNSVGEAMILGVPPISSDVGGVKNMLTHETDGFIYQHDAPYMLAYYICEIFTNDELALQFSKNARQHALLIHDREINLENTINIYKGINNI